MDVSKAAQLAVVETERSPFSCQMCDPRCAKSKQEGQTCQLPPSEVGADHSTAETTTLFISRSTVLLSPNPTGSHRIRLLMNHGLAQFRFATLLDTAVRENLAECFRMYLIRAITERASSKCLKNEARSFRSC
jgi:hypothetical protein